MNNAIVVAWLLDAATLLALALLFGCVAYGAALLFFPQYALEVSSKMNRRFSARKAMRPLEIPRTSERFFYRHHRIVGGLLLAGVVAFFVAYFFEFPRDSVMAKLGLLVGGPLAGVLLESLEIFFLLLNPLIGVLAIVMIIRPSALKPLERLANHWLSTRKALRHAEENRQPLDKIVHRFPRVAGLLILLAAGYIAAGVIVAAG